MLKIIEGKYNRRNIITPNNQETRPTSSRMRKSIFDILSHSRYFTDKIFNTKVLDVFAGSGIMGIECLSRGSTYCKFIDNSNESISTINKNLGNLNIKLHASVIKLDAIHPPSTTEKYGLSFFDPPYNTLNFSTIIARWEERGWFAKNAICIYEKRKDTLFSLPKKFFIVKNLTKGTSEVLILKKCQ